MTRIDTPKKPTAFAPRNLPDSDFDPPEVEESDEVDAPDSLAEETGLDLSDASLLDADNVLADEEFDRVAHGPD